VNVTQLFHVRDDPHELHNLAESNPEKLRELMNLLAELQKSNDDTAPLTIEKLDDPSVTPEKLREQAKLLAPRPQKKPVEKAP
jgi:hypothetical protein